MADPQLSQRLQSPQLWEKALGQLEPGVKARLMQVTGGRGNIVAALIKTVNEKRQLCIRRQYKFKTPSGRVVIIRDLLEKMAKWLDRFKGAVDAAVQYDPAHAALPWAAVRFILQIALDDIQAHGSIFEAVESFTRMMGRCAKVEELHLDKTNAATVFLEEALTRLYASILSALATALKYFDRSHAARLFTVIIEPSVLDTLEDQEQEVLKLVSLLDSETIKRLDQQFQRVMDTSTMIKVSMSQTRSVDCLAWLSGTRVHDHHRSISAAKIPGSCTWIFEQETYRTWLGDSSSSVLILQGIRGCGKSVLMSAIIDSLRERTPASTTPSVPCAFFYCAYLMTEPDRSSPDAILRSIIRQLAVVAVDESTCTIDEKLWKLYSQKLDAAQPDKINLPVLTCEECYSLLLEMTLTNPAYLVIDAVDELSDKARAVLLDMEADDLPTSDDGPIASFHSYAALHWWDHVRKSGDKDSLEGPTNSIMFEFVFDGNEPEISLAFYLWIDWMHLYAEALPIYHARKRLFGALWSTEGQPIFTASQFGLTALMRKYLEANNDIDVDTTNVIGHTGFYLAAAGGHTEIVRILHERNANAHIRCGWLGSPLQAACFHGKIETARLLLELGASARAEAKFSNALEAACRGNRPEVAQMLLEQGSVLETEDDFEAAVRWSTETGLEAVVDWLLKFAKPKSRPSAADQATHMATTAIKRGSIRNLKRLLAMNSGAEQVAPRDGIAIASYYGHVEMIEYLHELGLSLDVEGPYGSPLRSACLAGNEAAARLLISWGVDVDTRGEKGHALQAAAMQGHTRLVLLLISEGADVNTGIDRSDEPDPLGTPLEAASYYGNSTVVDILLKAGASPGAGGYFKDAMHAAIEGNQSAVAVHLLQAGYKVEKSLFGTGPAALMNPLGSKRMAELVASKVQRTEASPYDAKCYVWLTGDDEGGELNTVSIAFTGYISACISGNPKVALLFMQGFHGKNLSNSQKLQGWIAAAIKKRDKTLMAILSHIEWMFITELDRGLLQDAFVIASANGNIEAARMIYSHAFADEAQDTKQSVLAMGLMAACFQLSREGVILCIQLGADVNAIISISNEICQRYAAFIDYSDDDSDPRGKVLDRYLSDKRLSSGLFTSTQAVLGQFYKDTRVWQSTVFNVCNTFLRTFNESNTLSHINLESGVPFSIDEEEEEEEDEKEEEDEEESLYIRESGQEARIMQLLIDAGLNLEPSGLHRPMKDMQALFLWSLPCWVKSRSEILRRLDWTAEKAVKSLNGGIRDLILQLFRCRPSLRAQGIEFAMWLIVASAAGDKVMLDVLVDKGVSVNSTLATFNAINAAATMGHLSVVKKLHEAGALIVYDEASLRRVFSGNHVEVFEYLQENGLQADWSETRHCLVCEALDHGSMSIMKRLVDTTTQLHDHTLALIKICGRDKHSSDQVQMIQYLVDKKANLRLDGTRQVGYASLSTSPLIEACSASNIELVKFLLAHGADVGMPVQHGELNGRLDLYASTPLIAAAGLGNLQIVRILLENGADPNQVCRYSVSNWSTSTTPLSQACKNGRKAVVKELLSLDGLSTDSAQFSDAIACAMAARRGQKEMLELLLKRYFRSGMDEGVMRKALEKVPKWKPELVDVLLEYSPSDIVAEFDT
ncbi:Ankyrin repeat-containing protein [Cordyceps javanica]|uniref:Ankyrin repeat-containing protein n=1 Tax=Cordyceps javanica TaxID=43265 RepID=A0A545V576_9HYPO|nr:Ankyrin repeat-containing protein [Cordyceps javanica]TQW08124.1 Ankyrin repeat-containing protein [Cordyceps javanica]